MRRGMGWVQQACLRVIEKWERANEWPTTYNIAGDVYQVKRDKNGNRWISHAQYVAVKRALEGLQRKGRIIGFRLERARSPTDGRTELCHHWMTEQRAIKWLAERREITRWRESGRWQERLARFVQKAKAIGMKLD